MKQYRVVIEGILTHDLALALAKNLKTGIPDSLEVDIEEYEKDETLDEYQERTKPQAQVLSPGGIESREGVNGN